MSPNSTPNLPSLQATLVAAAANGRQGTAQAGAAGMVAAAVAAPAAASSVPAAHLSSMGEI